MKNLLATLLLSTILLGCAPKTPNDLAREGIQIDPEFKKPFKELVKIYKRNNIDFDYGLVHTIRHIDSTGFYDSYRYLGLYNRITREIFINPRMNPIYEGDLYHKILTLTLAHEMAHSQGYGHTMDTTSLMYVSDKFILELLKSRTVEELVVEIYKYPTM